MHCPQCKTEIAKGAAYCSKCGAQIMPSCPICGTQVLLGQNYCEQCGACIPDQTHPQQPTSKTNLRDTSPIPSPLPIQSEAYERRIVTILFADIANYSTLSESLDPELLLGIMNKTYPCLLEPIQAYGGTVVQVMGDGVLAYFGTPITQEDDPQRAVSAGLGIVSRVKSYAEQLCREQRLEDFNVRVGINTGLVVVGDLNPEKHLEYVALGDAVNLAARLQQIAPKDAVLISHETYRHIKGIFDVIPQIPMTVKGRQQIIQTYMVKQIKPIDRRQPQRGVLGIDTPMVGREPEMAVLQNVYQDAILGGETALILISGDAGIGKTRLSNAFIDWVVLQPTPPNILRSRAIPSTQSVPFGVFRHLFAKYFSILETDSSAQALTKFRQETRDILDQEQADLIGQLIGFDFSISPAVQRLIGEPSFAEIANLYLINYFRRLSEQPMLLLLEDLHWMDDNSLDLITEMVVKLSQEQQVQLMIVCTARQEFTERRKNWGEGIDGFIQIKLRRLSRLRSRSLIAAILRKVEVIPEALYECVVDIAEGNPFYIEELIKMLMEQGVIPTNGDKWQIELEKLAAIKVPPSLTGILQARFDSLPPPEKLVLHRAAVIGRTFWDGLLRTLTDEEVEAQLINTRLSALRERGLIFKRERSSIEGHQEYLFKHALVRDAAYETVLLKHRRLYHSQVAAWIEANAGERLEEHLVLIATHYANAGQSDLAADWTLRAGERAAKQYSMQVARTLFEQALSLIQSGDLERRWQATLGHSEAMGVLGDLKERHADDQALLDIAHQLKDDHRMAEAYYMIGSQAYREGNNPAAQSALDRALQAARTAGDLNLQAEILPMEVAILTAEGELESAAGLVDQALAIAQQSGDANILARALTNLSLYYQSIGDVTRSVDLIHQQIKINQEQGNRLGEAIGLNNLSYFYLSLGQFESGYTLLKQALQIAQKLEARREVAYFLLNMGLAEWRLGRPEDAIHTIENSLSKFEALGDQIGLAYRQLYMGLALEEVGLISEAIEQFSSAKVAFIMLDMTTLAIEAQAGLARLALHQNNLNTAENIAMQLYSYINEEGSQGFEMPMLVYLTCARVFNALGDQIKLKHTLNSGRRALQEHLDGISDLSWQKIFLEAVPENHALMTFSE